MNRKDEYQDETRSGQNNHRRQKDEEYCQYPGDEFEEVEAEAEASVQYSPDGTYKRMSIKARRTRASVHQRSQKQNEGKPEQGDNTGSEAHNRGGTEFSQRTRIPTSLAGRHQRGSASSVSLQLELQAKKSESTLSLLKKRMSSHSLPTQKTSVIQQRLNSANEIQIKDLTSKIRLLETTIQDLTAENRTLKSGFQRQAAALLKYEGAESDFPRVLNYHQNEVKYLQQSLRKAQSTCRKYEAMLRDANKRIVILEDQNGKLQRLVESDELDQRQKLQRQVMEMSQQVAETQETLNDYARQFEMLQKSHARQLGIVESKLKISDKRVYDAEQELYRLTELLRQKDRVISYLRMRSRNPGLEPPLHRKVMEEYKSSYKYFFQVVDSSEINQEFYYPQSTNSITTPSGCDFQTPHDDNDESYAPTGVEDETDLPVCQNPSTAQTLSTVPSSQEGEGIVYCRSLKSNGTFSSEELAQRSRERNLDVPCTASEFEDEQERDAGEGGDSEEETQENYVDEGLTENERMTAGADSHPGGGSEGSGTTYVFNKCLDESEVFEGYPDDEESHDLESDHNNNGLEGIREKGPFTNSTSNRTLSYEGGDNAYIHQGQSGEDLETDLENGGGDVGKCHHKFMDDREYTGEQTMSDDYSDEEFYCESGGENETPIRTPTGTNFSRGQDDTNESSVISPKTSPPRPSAPVKSGLYPLDNKYFMFTSKPTSVIGEVINSFASEDDNQTSGVISKHDSILKHYTPPPSSEVSRGGTAEIRAMFYKGSRVSSADPHRSLGSFNKKRPKELGIIDEFPFGSKYSGGSEFTDTNPDEVHTSELWTLGDPAPIPNRAEPLRRECVAPPPKETPAATKKNVGPATTFRNKQSLPSKQPIKNKPNRFTSF